MLDLNYDLESVANLSRLMEVQREKVERLRESVRKLEFVPIDPAGSYHPVTFKAFDGGRFNMHFDPFEFDIVEVADSDGNLKLKFAAPSGDFDDRENLKSIIAGLNSNPIIKKFLDMLGKDSLDEISEILTNKGSLMEIGEFACIFNKLATASPDERTIILKDGLLRTKKIKAELIDHLRSEVESNKAHVKLVGVAKGSKMVFLLKAALMCENIFPRDQIGYVEIPRAIENKTYTWSGHGKVNLEKPLDYAFGSLYIAKLSRAKNMLVTVEIPKDLKKERKIYSNAEVMEIMGYLAKDSMYSYPIIGYPQTIMRAHEHAVSLGLPSSILRDKIMDKLIKNTDPSLAEYVRDSRILGEIVEKGSLGGRV